VDKTLWERDRVGGVHQTVTPPSPQSRRSKPLRLCTFASLRLCVFALKVFCNLTPFRLGLL
jgi:hypothetical protein